MVAKSIRACIKTWKQKDNMPIMMKAVSLTFRALIYQLGQFNDDQPAISSVTELPSTM